MRKMMPEMYDELKETVWDSGVEAIDELLGYEHDVNEDKDVTDARMDEALDQMPEKEALSLWDKYCAEPVKREGMSASEKEAKLRNIHRAQQILCDFCECDECDKCIVMQLVDDAEYEYGEEE